MQGCQENECKLLHPRKYKRYKKILDAVITSNAKMCIPDQQCCGTASKN